MSNILIFFLLGSALFLTAKSEEHSEQTGSVVSTGKTESSEVAMAEAQADFALKLFKADPSLDDKPSIMSPISVAIALAMTYAGAEGNTKTQMENVLAQGSNKDEILKFFAATMNELAQSNTGYKLEAANKVFVKGGLALLPTYINIIKKTFMGQLQEINFGAAAAAAKLINDWVEEKTNGKIKDLLSPGSISDETRMILVNAIYFKGQWMWKFKEGETKLETFYAKQNEERKVDMMRIKSSFSYISNSEVAVLGMPYKEREVYMYVFLPHEKYGLGDFLNKTTGKQLLELIKNSVTREVKVRFPKFKIDTKLGLVPALQSIGLTNAFSGSANFSGISKEDLFISDVIHQAFVEVNEEGTEAAAATAIVMMATSLNAAPPEPIRFTADHPFLFTIVKGDIILFMGAYY
ncbi:hypothetical protein AB6A40_000248 [Gnathostoma spinigerum]|uniref:Serpin domain-containing protein n=1 Tax=Gnathostoma spinigerum TaxID=75299 RepID=A0ABD6E5Z9_9BILA